MKYRVGMDGWPFKRVRGGQNRLVMYAVFLQLGVSSEESQSVDRTGVAMDLSTHKAHPRNCEFIPPVASYFSVIFLPCILHGTTAPSIDKRNVTKLTRYRSKGHATGETGYD